MCLVETSWVFILYFIILENFWKNVKNNFSNLNIMKKNSKNIFKIESIKHIFKTFIFIWKFTCKTEIFSTT